MLIIIQDISFKNKNNYSKIMENFPKWHFWCFWPFYIILCIIVVLCSINIFMYIVYIKISY